MQRQHLLLRQRPPQLAVVVVMLMLMLMLALCGKLTTWSLEI